MGFELHNESKTALGETDRGLGGSKFRTISRLAEPRPVNTALNRSLPCNKERQKVRFKERLM